MVAKLVWEPWISLLIGESTLGSFLGSIAKTLTLNPWFGFFLVSPTSSSDGSRTLVTPRALGTDGEKVENRLHMCWNKYQSSLASGISSIGSTFRCSSKASLVAAIRSLEIPRVRRWNAYMIFHKLRYPMLLKEGLMFTGLVASFSLRLSSLFSVTSKGQVMKQVGKDEWRLSAGGRLLVFRWRIKGLEPDFGLAAIRVWLALLSASWYDISNSSSIFQLDEEGWTKKHLRKPRVWSSQLKILVNDHKDASLW